LQQAKRLGVTDDITSGLAHIEKEKRDIEIYRKRLGIEKLKKFSSEQNLINKLNLKVDLSGFLYSHGFVHGEDIAQTHRRRKIQPRTFAFFSHTHNPKFLAMVALAAAQSLIDTHEAAGKMFGWEVSPELRELVATIQSLQES
jgi:hypothetical protein